MIDVKKFLREHSEPKYVDFSRKMIVSEHQILGVRIPTLKKFAKEIEPEYVDLEADNVTHEEILLFGYAASLIKNEDEQIEYLTQILPFFDNWCTCDCVTGAMSEMTGEKSFEFFEKLTKERKPYFVRSGIVGLMKFFMKERTAAVVKIVKSIKTSEKTVKMAVGWFLCELATYDFPFAKKIIESWDEKTVKNIAISKIQQSYRISKEEKTEILDLKKK